MSYGTCIVHLQGLLFCIYKLLMELRIPTLDTYRTVKYLDGSLMIMKWPYLSFLVSDSSLFLQVKEQLCLSYLDYIFSLFLTLGYFHFCHKVCSSETAKTWILSYNLSWISLYFKAFNFQCYYIFINFCHLENFVIS